MEDLKQFEVINFTNIDLEDYVGMWGGKEETIPTGKTVQKARFLAEHYAFHLAKKILIRAEKESGDEALIKELTDKILGRVAVPAETPEVKTETVPEFEDLEKETIETEKTEPEIKKRGRPRKVA